MTPHKKRHETQVSVQPSTAAVDATLLAFAAAAPLLLGAGRAAVDRYLPPAEPTAANPPRAAAAVESWDRKTYRRTD